MGTETDLWEDLRKRILMQRIEGYHISQQGPDHLRIVGENHCGEVNSYELDGPMRVMEMRITRRSDGEQVFFLHFRLDDLSRAQELFGEMTDVLCDLAKERHARVLLSCTCGITTTMFAAKMSELSDALGLGYDVQAKPLECAVTKGSAYDAVMLAPQVSYERRRVTEAYPDAVVVEIPARVFGTYDVSGALLLLTDALKNVHKTL